MCIITLTKSPVNKKENEHGQSFKSNFDRAGNRGETYTDIMAQMSDKFKVIAVAEPIESRRNNIQKNIR